LLDSNNSVDVIYLDFAKESDKVPMDKIACHRIGDGSGSTAG